MSARRPAHVVAVLAAVLVAGVALVGCGIGLDDEPRALQVEASTTTVTVPSTGGQVSTVLYYVLEGALVPMRDELPDRTPSTLFAALAQTPTTSTVGGLGSSIPAGTELLGTTRAGDRLIMDLSSEFDNVVGLSRQQAIGQMVLTVTQQSPVERLEFQVDGEPITVSSPLRGDTTVVDECDFTALLASVEDIAGAGLPPESVSDLAARRTQLARDCDNFSTG